MIFCLLVAQLPDGVHVVSVRWNKADCWSEHVYSPCILFGTPCSVALWVNESCDKSTRQFLLLCIYLSDRRVDMFSLNMQEEESVSSSGAAVLCHIFTSLFPLQVSNTTFCLCKPNFGASLRRPCHQKIWNFVHVQLVEQPKKKKNGFGEDVVQGHVCQTPPGLLLFLSIDTFDNKPFTFFISTNRFCFCSSSRTIGAQTGVLLPSADITCIIHPNMTVRNSQRFHIFLTIFRKTKNSQNKKEVEPTK